MKNRKMFQNYSQLKNCYVKSNYCASLAIRKILCINCPTKRFYRHPHGIFSPGLAANYLSPNRLPNGAVLKKCDTRFALLLGRHFGNERNKKLPNEVPNKFPHHYFFMASAITLYLYFLFKTKVNSISRVTWPIFLQDFLSKGKVDKIIVFPSSDTVVIYVKENVTINGKQEYSRIYYMTVTDNETFENDLREEEARLGISPSDGVTLVYARPSLLFNFMLVLIPVVVVILLFKFFNKMVTGMNPFANISRAKFTLIDPLTGYGKGVRISDVAGLKEAKQEVMEFVDYLKRPEHYKNLGAKVPKGALLLGPPGCGKTLLAKAVATEANVPFLSMNGSEFVELIGGLGAARVRDLFSEARKRSPCIIYVDEIDTIGKKRAESSVIDGSQSEGEHTLNQLLVEMDGMASREGVVMLASTNRAEILDKALLRPGRFDRHILIDFPTLDERREIFMQHLKSIHLEYKPEYYVKRMASLTPGFSGADIANICNEAALHAARYKKKVVKGEDLEYAVERVVGGTEKRSSAIGPEEKRMVAYHEAGRALVGWVSENGEALLKISVVPRTHLSIGWVQFTPPEQFLFSQNELFDKMCVALGGRVAESLIFNKISTKAEKDLQKVTRIAYAQVRQYGMNKIVGLVSFGEVAEHHVKPYSKQLSALIDEEARKLIARAYLETESLLRANKDKLVKLAEELLKRETLNYADVVALIGPPKNEGKKVVEPLEFDLAFERAAGPDPPPKEEQIPKTAEQEERNDSSMPFLHLLKCPISSPFKK